MAKLTRLAAQEDNLVTVLSPLSKKEIDSRHKDYNSLSPKRFATKYKELLFLPVEFTWNGKSRKIQYNYCANPFCKWHGLQQNKFSTKGKPGRYRLSGSDEKKRLKCNPDPIAPTIGMTHNCNNETYSNWSIAEEISRLKRIESVVEVEPEYQFHKEWCHLEGATPFSNPKSFQKRGKSKVGAQVWQCKTCMKKTNLLPTKRKSTTYHQQRSEILPLFMKLLLGRNPVTRTCEILDIGRGTYYKKLELLYQRCLEFLDKFERKPLLNKEFNELWLNTDSMVYYLNNVRQKGQGGSKYDGMEESKFPTEIIVTAEGLTRYVFRADVAYDWDITIGEIASDTHFYKEDHLNEFAKRHGRFGDYSHFPMPPTKNDTQTESDYYNEVAKVDRRGKYVAGLHVGPTYTTIAHFWLIKQLVKASEWRFITDKSHSLMTSLFRVFAKEFQLTEAHHFLSRTDKTKSRKVAYTEFKLAQIDLIEWGQYRGYNTRSLRKLAFLQLTELLQHHQFHEEMTVGTHTYRVHANNSIQHPLATIDRGFRAVDCTTDLSSYEPDEIANLIMEVNDNATNSFIQLVRRKISILERPLMTARGDKKSYIYSNFNPRYAQYAATILRTYYNFCKKYRSSDKRELTPAQRLGITDKQFTIQDIIYQR